MKAAIALIVALVVVAFGLVVVFGYSTTNHEPQKAKLTGVIKGWNTIVVPESWVGVTSKDVTSQNPAILALSYEDSNDTWHSYLPKYTDAYVFELIPGQSVMLYASMDCTVVVK